MVKAPLVTFSNHFSLVASYDLRLNIGLRFRKTDDFPAFLPLAALFQKLNPFEAF